MEYQTSDIISSSGMTNISGNEFWFSNFEGIEHNPWIGSVIGAVVVVLSGVFPILVIPVGGEVNFSGGGSERLRRMLSFAVGGLLGDVFLHLLPEAWNSRKETIGKHPPLNWGLWVLGGLLAFTFAEKVFAGEKSREPEEVALQEKNSHQNNNNNNCDKNKKQVSGYLNLMANVMDNFTHGLAVGGSFVLSWRVGALSTLAILIHEVPHEVGDFAILLRAGFSRWEAAVAQLATASSSLLGAATAVVFSGASDLIEAKTSWILPFTAGGFLHIALVTVLPELLQEKDPKESVWQMGLLILGVSVMAAMTIVFD